MKGRGCEVVGIDLGSEFMSLGYIDESSTPRALALDGADVRSPTAVYFDGADVRVGRAAVELLDYDMHRGVRDAVSNLGTSWTRKIDGRSYSAEEIAALLVRHLVREAETLIGPIREAVFTLPGHFDQRQQSALLQAARLARLGVAGFVSKPVAALLGQGGPLPSDQEVVLVYHLGSRTFEATVIRAGDGAIQELSSRGNRELGGVDWTRALVGYLSTAYRRMHGRELFASDAAWAAAKRICERAKLQLSDVPQARMMRSPHLMPAIETEIRREEYEDLTRNLLEVTRMTTNSVMDEADLQWRQISRVVLSGGAARMPAISRMLSAEWERDIVAGARPDLAVVLGAARYAQQFDPSLDRGRDRVPNIVNVARRSIGITARRDDQSIISILIPKNAPLPARAMRLFRVTTQGSRLRLPITEGEGETVEAFGTAILDFPRGTRRGAQVRLDFVLESEGRLRIDATLGGVPLAAELQLEAVAERAGGDIRHLESVAHGGIAGTLNRWEELETFDEQPKNLSPALSASEGATPAEDGSQSGDGVSSQRIDENVQFTVICPKWMRLTKWYQMLAFAHLSELPLDAAPDEPRPQGSRSRRSPTPADHRPCGIRRNHPEQPRRRSRSVGIDLRACRCRYRIQPAAAGRALARTPSAHRVSDAGGGGDRRRNPSR